MFSKFSRLTGLHVFVFALVVAHTAVAAILLEDEADCRCFPGEECWPDENEWARFNATVDGRLIATVPLAYSCHDPNFNADECARIREEWLFPSLHMESSSSIMAPLFANDSCEPFKREKPCLLGNYVYYAVNISTTNHVTATLRFAHKNNIRIVIRNTGHDYNGRSTGAGALAIWTHHLKESRVLDWKDKYYQGKALKIGAGVQGFEAQAAASKAGLVIVTGECPSVGIAGGYTQGGGHSDLVNVFGLSADNTLAFDVITAQGRLIKASRTEHQDMYWALSGGGGGTYGVVYSMTVRAHPDRKVSGTRFTINIHDNNTHLLYGLIDSLHDALPYIAESRASIIYGFDTRSFQIYALTAYNKTKAQAQAIFQPFINSISRLGISIEPLYTEFNNYTAHYDHYWGPLPNGIFPIGTMLNGGRLMPRKPLPSFGKTIHQLVDMGVIFGGIATDLSRFGKNNANAVLPQWRNSAAMLILSLPWSFDVPFENMIAAQNRITYDLQPLIEAVTPGAGAYMNEADVQQPNWQETFYGSNYHKLLSIKRKFDPDELFYVRTGVGSEGWTQRQDGRLCRIRTDKRDM